jgi:hypothetical protein
MLSRSKKRRIAFGTDERSFTTGRRPRRSFDGA